MSGVILVLMILFLIGGAALIFYGFKSFHQFQIIRDTPTSKIRSMAMGLVEIAAIVVGARFITTPFSQQDCVYYYYYVDEYQLETSTDSDGDIDFDYKWKRIAKGERGVPFYAADETGETYIDPKGAKIDARVKNAYYQDYGTGWGKQTIKNALREFDNSNNMLLDINGSALRPIDPNQIVFTLTKVGDRRYYESYISPDEKLYILGTAARNPDSGPEVLIKKGQNEPIFLISYKSEKKLSSSLKWRSVGFLLVGSILIILGLILLYLTIMTGG